MAPGRGLSPRSPEQRLLLAGGIGVLLGAFDGAVIATALPRILADLDGPSSAAWIAGAYMLGTAVAVPAWGALGDRHGHGHILRVGLWILFAATFLAAIAGTLSDALGAGLGAVELALFRLVQGIGSGAIFSASFALLAELYPSRQRARYAGRFSLILAVATVVGPIVGGAMAEGLTARVAGIEISGWRFIFVAQLPFLLAALAVAGRGVGPGRGEATGNFDLAGLVIIAAIVLAAHQCIEALRTAGPAPAALLWGGAALAGGAAMAAVERRARAPLLSARLLRLPFVGAACLAGAGASAALVCFAVGVPGALQLGLGYSPSASGAVATAFAFGIAIGIAAGGRWIARTGDCRAPGFAGAGLALVMLATLWIASADLTGWIAQALLAGLGFGLIHGTVGIAGQHGAPVGRFGAVNSLVQFCRRIGATVGGFAGGLVVDGMAGGADSEGCVAPMPLAAMIATMTAFLCLALAGIACMPRERLPEDFGTPASP